MKEYICPICFGRKTIPVEKEIKCGKCSGWTDNSHCPRCYGSGVQHIIIQIECDYCHGKGKIIEQLPNY